MRACTKCGEMKPLEAFPPVRRGEAKLQTWCRECFAEANARNYRKNHEREKTRLIRQVNERRAEVRQKIVEYLQTHPCVDCGERDIVVLEFDHLSDKVADISVYAGGGRTWARIKAEIEKCEVRCANCHRRKTRERSAGQKTRSREAPTRLRPTPPPIQLSLEATLGIRTCRVCGESKPLAEFPYRSLKRQTRQWICLLCQREYTNEWYSRNRKRQIANAKVRSLHAESELKSRVREYLLDHPCVDCGQSDLAVLDFDHLRDKRANVSTLVQSGVSWDSLADEIAKCDVRCANCHRRRTARNGRYYRTLATIARIDEPAR
jgi:Zn finger protein HypA/HybF involved in hydrogenase expression